MVKQNRPRKAIIKPKAHQRKAIRAGVNHFKEHDNGVMVMPCGSGKTLTSLWLAAELKARRTIITIPTLQLQGQALAAWKEDLAHDGIDHSVIIIGSDITVGREFGIIPTTDTAAILKHLKEAENKPLFVLTTYQSSKRLVDLAVRNKIHFDLCIFDEAHHTAGSEKMDFQALLRSPEMKVSKRLFMTATPRVLQGKIGSEEVELFSMDDEKVYGKEFYRLTISEAIAQGIICEYKIATLFTSSEETTKLIKSDAILVDKKLDGIKDGSREFSVALAILKAIKRYNLHHVIAFTGTIEESIRFQKLLMNVSKVMEQKIDVFHIDGTISEKNRNDILNEYHASPCAIVTNAKLLGEGFDMPAVDAVAFVTDKSSVTDIVQASGRAWRLSEGKEFGYILLPCVLDEEKKPIKQDFLNLRRVVAALSANDEVLYNYFKQSNNNSSNRRGRPIEFENQPLGFDLMKFSESLKLTVWRSLKLIETLNTKIVPWQEAAEFTMSLSIHGITSIKKWDLYNNNHTLFPGAPDKKKGVPRDLRKAYGKDYKPSLFFSKPKARGGWATAKEAAAFTYSLSAHGIINSGTYQWYCRRQNAFPGAPPKPLNIPTKPWLIYGDDYKPELFFSQPSLDRNKNWASAEECARFTSSLAAFGVTNYKKYIRYCKDETMFPGAPKRPTNIPSDPRVVYKEEFRNDKFFPGAISYSTYLPWEEVATFTLSLGKFGVDSHEKWMSYFDDESKFPGAPKRLEGIPKMIRNVYRENYSPSKFFTNGRDVLDIPPWEEVAEFTRSLEKFGIDNYSKWWKYWDDESHFPGAPKRPINYRKNLHTVYGDKFVATIFFTNTRDNKRKGIKFKK